MQDKIIAGLSHQDYSAGTGRKLKDGDMGAMQDKITECCEKCDYRQWVDGEMDVTCRNPNCPCHQKDKGLEQLLVILEEVKELIDNPRTGLKESSNTNKTRYGILALIVQAHTQATASANAHWREKIRNMEPDIIKETFNGQE